jgi:hypothetical protein
VLKCDARKNAPVVALRCVAGTAGTNASHRIPYRGNANQRKATFGMPLRLVYVPSRNSTQLNASSPSPDQLNSTHLNPAKNPTRKLENKIFTVYSQENAKFSRKKTPATQLKQLSQLVSWRATVTSQAKINS